jgi:hypothetical protein
MGRERTKNGERPSKITSDEAKRMPSETDALQCLECLGRAAPLASMEPDGTSAPSDDD